MSNHSLTDTELWHAVRNDDASAFNMLFDRYWIRLYKTAHFYLDDREVCAEAVNDVFVSIWNRRKELEIVSFCTFMQTSVRYQIYKRRKAVKLEVIFKENLVDDAHFQLNDGEIKIQQTEIDIRLNGHLDKLPKRCQEIFELSRFDNLSNQEIAERLNISKRTVENQLALAVKHLRLCFKHICILLFAYLFM
ncbi:sigma-70 family RNA polymerase sigma factor [Mucilaginibacter flavus]|uniref:sigma-70 family RNA polymerase sigma factor n=1 Tax=Mucilaginibacter flavus TaxID=931504 RepID=UPI0025B4046C|nr:sigma-70 family RNA polymerase sigma factor [Mucilaginibacter flavus]MDN3580903.1 sigma-70 family RNA polymerase sigma factor [Mucilaginibacter flavus]